MLYVYPLSYTELRKLAWVVSVVEGCLSTSETNGRPEATHYDYVETRLNADLALNLSRHTSSQGPFG